MSSTGVYGYQPQQPILHPVSPTVVLIKNNLPYFSPPESPHQISQQLLIKLLYYLAATQISFNVLMPRNLPLFIIFPKVWALTVRFSYSWDAWITWKIFIYQFKGAFCDLKLKRVDLFDPIELFKLGRCVWITTEIDNQFISNLQVMKCSFCVVIWNFHMDINCYFLHCLWLV